MIHSDQGVLSSAKKKKMSYQPMKRHGVNLKCILLSDRSQTEKATYYMILTLWHSGEDTTVEIIKSCQELGEGGVNKWCTEDFFRAVKLFCMTL